MNKEEQQEIKNTVGVLYLVSQSEPEAFSHRIRLQKLVLLAKLEFGYPFSYDYQSYYYGPYSFDLRKSVGHLNVSGYLKETEETSPFTGESIYRYAVTTKGRELIDKYFFGELRDELKKLNNLWQKYGKLTNDTIIAKAKEVSNLARNKKR